MSSSNGLDQADAPTRILDAAARAVSASGRPPGIAELARLAGISRPTVYRHFADEPAVFRALWEREIGWVLQQTPRIGDDRAGLVRQVGALAEKISRHDLLAPTFASDPSLVARYILDRLGTGQQVLLESLCESITLAQNGGTVRAGDPRQLAAMTLLIAQSAIQSRRMIAEHLPDPAWRRELEHAVNGYLAP
jgi:AcrR family transcriptional regulator